MARSKVEYWLTDDGLILLQGWARDGLTDEQIAANIGVSRKTLSEWKVKYGDIGDTLKKGKDIADYEVENALYKKAVSGDVTAMIFWLKNRRKHKWRDKPEENAVNVNVETNIGTDPYAGLTTEELRTLARMADNEEST